MAISIHAPREGSDREQAARRKAESLFQSTLPARGATDEAIAETKKAIISIHAPREGSDRRGRHD